MPAADPVLFTRFFVPDRGANHIERPRLTSRLTQGWQRNHCLALVSAPPGYGKTSLLSEWIDTTKVPAIWLSLDEEENDPAIFWPQLVAAIQQASPYLVASAKSYLSSVARPESRAVAALLSNSLVGHQASLIIVLDDFHHIHHTDISSGLEFFLDCSPRQCMLAIGTRADPPLPLARLRACGRLTELRANDLALRCDETYHFFSRQSMPRLARRDIEALHLRTEGWPVGLQLAVLSLENRSDPHSFVSAFSGSHAHVLSYLVEEAIARLPQALRLFLIRTSILDRLSAPLCTAVTNDCQSLHHLDEIRRRNLFLVPLDDEGRWFRYHHLFADLVRQLLTQEQPEQVPDLHRRAAEWYAQHDLAEAAIRHAYQSADPAFTADLIGVHWERTIHRGNVAVVNRWFEMLPDELLYSDPSFLLAKSWAQHLSGHTEQIAVLLASVDQQIAVGKLQSGQLSPTLNTSYRLLRSIVARHDGDVEGAIQHASAAIESTPMDNPNALGVAWNLLASAQFSADEIEASIYSFGKGISLARAGGNLLSMSVSTFYRTALLKRQGRLHEAEIACRAAIAVDAAKGSMGESEPIPAIGLVHIALADLLLERNQLDAAQKHLDQGIEQAEPGGFVEVATQGNFIRARVARARGDLASAHEALDEAERLLHWLDEPRLQIEMYIGRIRLHLCVNDIASAKSTLCLLERHVEDATQVDMARLVEEIRCRVMIADQDARSVLPRLESLAHQAKKTGSNGHLVRLQLLLAIGHYHLGRVESAVDEFKAALQLGLDREFLRVFMNEGSAVAPLLDALRVQSPLEPSLRDYVLQLKRELDSAERDQIAHESLVEPLSQREIEIARLIAAGLSNKEIAEQLVISVNTVKTHTSHLYGKLGVTNRTQAAARVRELHLVSS